MRRPRWFDQVREEAEAGVDESPSTGGDLVDAKVACGLASPR